MYGFGAIGFCYFVYCNGPQIHTSIYKKNEVGPTRKPGFEAEFCSLGTKNQPKNVADDPHFTFIPHLLPLLSLFVSLLINCLS